MKKTCTPSAHKARRDLFINNRNNNLGAAGDIASA